MTLADALLEAERQYWRELVRTNPTMTVGNLGDMAGLPRVTAWRRLKKCGFVFKGTAAEGRWSEVAG